MDKEHPIVEAVFAAKTDSARADGLIRDCLPFIRGQASRFLGRPCTDQDDEYSIAMIAFHEAIQNYSRMRGPFLRYAALTIRSRLIDYHRREKRHKGQISLFAPHDEEDGRTLADTLPEERDRFAEAETREATRREIEELAAVLQRFGASFSDIADNCPHQQRTLEACGQAVRYAAANPDLLEELLHSGRLPLARLAEGSGVARKTLERHRRYLLAMLLIQTNGYEIIRGHLRRVLNRGEEATA